MKHPTGRSKYFLTVLLVLGLSLAYVKHRDLQGRYHEYRNLEADVQLVEEQVDLLREDLAHSKERVDKMDSDRLEKEAVVREIRRGVYPDETVFHVKARPVDE